MIKNLKINTQKFKDIDKEKIKLYTNCFLIAGTIAIGMKTLNIGLPFYIDNVKQQVYNVNHITSNNQNITYTSTTKQDNLIYYYDSWQQYNETNKRNYKIYRLKNTSQEELLTELEKIKRDLIDPIAEGCEYKELISKEELEQNEYWQAFIYDKLENNYIIIKETNLHNFISTIIYLLTTSGLCCFPYSIYNENKIKEKKV